MWLSTNFSLSEMIFSETSIRYGIDNSPTPEVLENLKRLCAALEEVRVSIDNRSIFVNSGYRSPALNRAIGGAKNSVHMTGLAADIRCRLSPREFASTIVKSGIKFDQVILEFDSWVHFGLSVGPMRQQVLTAKKVNGKTVYYNGIV